MKIAIDEKDPVLFDQYKKIVQDTTGLDVKDITQIVVDIPATKPSESPEMLAQMFRNIFGNRKLT